MNYSGFISISLYFYACPEMSRILTLRLTGTFRPSGGSEGRTLAEYPETPNLRNSENQRAPRILDAAGDRKQTL
jgi:hypothetical protein